MNEQRKPILAIDFDGVIHSYEKGWHDGSIYGTVVHGFFPWLIEASAVFRVVIVSSRLHEVSGSTQINDWLRKHWGDAVEKGEINDPMPPLGYSTTRPPAWVTIDDRALTFNGDWFAEEMDPETLLQFMPWHARNKI